MTYISSAHLMQDYIGGLAPACPIYNQTKISIILDSIRRGLAYACPNYYMFVCMDEELAVTAVTRTMPAERGTTPA